MGPDPLGRPAWAARIAFATLVTFLLAATAAIAVTLLNVPDTTRILAVAAVGPILAVTFVLLHFERGERGWSYGAAALLGLVGVTLRLWVNAHPDLEVGGGLPLSVNVAYVAMGVAVVGTSLWAYLARVATPARPAPPP